MHATRVAILGLDVGDLVADAVRALIDLLIPDFAADWTTRLVTWLVALPPGTGGAFPSLNRYAHELTAIGFGLLGATFIASAVQLAAAATRSRPRRHASSRRWPRGCSPPTRRS